MYEDSDLFSWSAEAPIETTSARFRLVAVDLDSILQPNSTLHPVDAASLRIAHSVGVKVVLVSALPPQGMHRFWAQLGLGAPVIALNGALVYDFPTHRQVLGQPIEAEKLRQVIQVVQRLAPRAAVGLELGETWVTNRKGPAAQTMVRQTGVWPSSVGDLRSALEEPAFQVWIEAPGKQLDQIETELAGAGLVISRNTAPDLLVLRSQAASRGWALSSLAALLEVAPHEVMAVGAGGRDRSMLQAAAFTVLVSDIGREPETSAAESRELVQTQGLAEAFARYLAPEGSEGSIWPSIEH